MSISRSPDKEGGIATFMYEEHVAEALSVLFHVKKSPRKDSNIATQESDKESRIILLHRSEKIHHKIEKHLAR